MGRTLRRRLTPAAACAVLTTLACKESAGPTVPAVASVQVTSPIDTILAAGRTAQLAGSPKDASGNAVSAALGWTSSNTSIATVNGSGLVTALAAGNATITATAQSGASSQSGTLRLRVVAADLAAVSTLAGDQFATSLIQALTTDRKNVAQPAAAACATNAGSGNVAAIISCITTLRTAAAAATDGTDRAVMAVLGLFVDQIEHQLAL